MYGGCAWLLKRDGTDINRAENRFGRAPKRSSVAALTFAIFGDIAAANSRYEQITVF